MLWIEGVSRGNAAVHGGDPSNPSSYFTMLFVAECDHYVLVGFKLSTGPVA